MGPMRLARFAKVLLAALLAAAGCGTGGHVPTADGGLGAGGGGTSGSGGSGGTSTSTTGDPCAQCPVAPPLKWDRPALLWVGDKSDAPECPIDALKVGYEGYADLEAPHDCGTCTCGASIGSCALPKTMAANAATCALDNGSTPHTPFDPSSGWTGACDTDVSIASGKLCSGVHCVKSLTIGPLTVDEAGCTPSEPPAVQAEPKWKTFARACIGAPTECNDGLGICLAEPPKELGFRVCVFQYGDHDCTGGDLAPYTEKHVFYAGYDDTRTCAPCACNGPTGGGCSSNVSVFTDGACMTLAYSTTVTSTGPDCHDLPSGSPLGSKSATAPTYTPGTCTPGGGGPTGGVTLLDPATLCCIPLP